MSRPLRIGGLDMSVNSTGYCAPNGMMFSLRPRAGADDEARRLSEVRALLTRAIRMHPPIPTHMVVERYVLPFPKKKRGEDGQMRGPSPAVRTAFQLGEVGGVLKTVLFDFDIEYTTVTPSTLKRFATGDGHADKTKMVYTATSRILAADPNGRLPQDDDQADAWHLARMGRVASKLEDSLADYEFEAIDASSARFW